MILARNHTVVERRITAKYLPLAIRTDGLPCLVVGGGRIGARKTATLLAADARVTVLSPEISPRLAELVQRGRIQWHQAKYELSRLAGFRLVIAATADRRLNRQIGRDAERQGILSCVVSSADSSRVIFPAVWRDRDITVAVHSQGRDCRRSQAVRDRIAAWLLEAHQSCESHSGGEEPKDNGLVRPVKRRATAEAAENVGRVYVVGAGPGSADLISQRGYQALLSADAILVDQLVPATFLDDLGISSDGKLVEHLGKVEPRWSQETINRWLAATAKRGLTVVRLKGGDPFVFGHGDSEIDYLEDRGIPWEVIPGASSATAVLTAAGLPLTRHGRGRSFAVTTARVERGQITASFPRADSLVILMGIGVLDQVIARLLGDGWSSDAPAAIVERGTLPWERHVSGSLCQLPELARRENVASPALVVVGEAAKPIATVHRRPTILFTGLDPTRFRSLGNLLHWPAQAVLSNPEGRERLPEAVLATSRGKVDWVVFTDELAVRTFSVAMADRRLDARVLQGVRVAASGTGTVRRLAQCHLYADVATTESDLRDALTKSGDLSRRNVLVVQGSHASHRLCRTLREAGAVVTSLDLHRLVPHPELGRPLPEHDVIYFVSPAGVHAYARAYGPNAFLRSVWCLGEATQRALAEHGVAARVMRPNTRTTSVGRGSSQARGADARASVFR